MHLIEVLMAGTVFAIASGSSLQLWSATAVRAHQLTGREQLEHQIEQDRLELQALWRNSALNQALNKPATADGDQTKPQTAEGLQGPAPTIDPAPPPGCAATATQLLALASNRPAAKALYRDIQLSLDGRALQIQWQARGDTVVQRHRLVTPAGLGLCTLPAPEADQAEQLQPTPPDQSQSETQSQSQPKPSDATPLTDSEVEGVPE